MVRLTRWTKAGWAAAISAADPSRRAANPSRTGLGTGHGWSPLLPILKLVSAVAAQSPEEGARASVYLAASPQVAGVTGRFFYREAPIASSADSHHADAARRLWALSEELTGLVAS